MKYYVRLTETVEKVVCVIADNEEDATKRATTLERDILTYGGDPLPLRYEGEWACTRLEFGDMVASTRCPKGDKK